MLINVIKGTGSGAVFTKLYINREINYFLAYYFSTNSFSTQRNKTEGQSFWEMFVQLNRKDSRKIK